MTREDFSPFTNSLLLSLLGLLTVLYFLFIKKSKNDEKLKNIPGPTPLPLLGNSLHFVGLSEGTASN